MVKSTGVYLTETQITEAKRRSREARETPVIKANGRWLHEDAEAAFKRWIDELAVSRGLQAPGLIEGEVNHYGVSPQGEFVVYVPDEQVAQ
jgi:hypothetical protein